jgi:hypothetical protein
MTAENKMLSIRNWGATQQLIWKGQVQTIPRNGIVESDNEEMLQSWVDSYHMIDWEVGPNKPKTKKRTKRSKRK